MGKRAVLDQIGPLAHTIFPADPYDQELCPRALELCCGISRAHALQIIMLWLQFGAHFQPPFQYGKQRPRRAAIADVVCRCSSAQQETMFSTGECVSVRPSGALCRAEGGSATIDQAIYRLRHLLEGREAVCYFGTARRSRCHCSPGTIPVRSLRWEPQALSSLWSRVSGDTGRCSCRAGC